MTERNTFAAIHFLRAIHFIGEDAGIFLQGQLTADTQTLQSGQWTRAAYCSPKGRVIASMLLGRNKDEYIVILSADNTTAVATRLSRFVLRAKVKIIALPATSISAQQHSDTTASNGILEATTKKWFFHDDGWRLRATFDDRPIERSLDKQWQQEQILRGIPWIGVATSELFIPQHINFELLNGINFKKGCYVGQEIIARLHYLGKIKRRGYILSGAGTPPLPGEKINGSDVINATGDSKSGFVAFVSAPCTATTDEWEWNGHHLQLRQPPYSLL